MSGLIVTGQICLLRNRVREYAALGVPKQKAPIDKSRAAPRYAKPRSTVDACIRNEGSGHVKFEITTQPPELYGGEYSGIELNGTIGKGLTPEDYTALVAYLDKNARRIYPRQLQEEPRWPHFYELVYLLHGAAVTVPKPLGWLCVEGFPPAVDYVMEQLMAHHQFLKRPREVDVK